MSEPRTGGGHWVTTGQIYDLVLGMKDEINALKTTVKILSYVVMPVVSAIVAGITNQMLGAK